MKLADGRELESSDFTYFLLSTHGHIIKIGFIPSDSLKKLRQISPKRLLCLNQFILIFFNDNHYLFMCVVSNIMKKRFNLVELELCLCPLT